MAPRRRCNHFFAIMSLVMAVGLHSCSLINPAWASAARIRFSLWESCELMVEGWVCTSIQNSGREWQLYTLTQTLYSFGITLIALVLAVFLFICGPYRYAFWVVALLQISAVTLQIYTLMLYTSTLVEDGIIQSYQQLEMGYKLAWEAAAFNIFSALLYFMP